jgi:uncharacterized membrane protein YfcA
MTFALIGALFIGISLGLLGSGGSILTVPVLVYLVGQDPKVAIAGSLLIVGIISTFAAIPYARQKLIKWRTVVVFGVPGMLGALLGAWLAHFVSGQEHEERAIYKIAFDGLIVGAVTGLVGVGGGFLIIPALVLLGGLSMRLAVGTSLVIIAVKSFAGFVEYLRVLEGQSLSLDWQVVILFSVLGVLGSWLGQMISSKINQSLLKKIFAVFLVLMGLFILYKNLPGLV